MSAPAYRLLFPFALLVIALAPTGQARAADPKAGETALNKVPADAEAFAACLRLGETVETIGKSRAWKRLWGNAVVQEAWKQARQKYDAGEGEWAVVKKFLEAPENKDLPALVADAFSNEVFVYAGAGSGDVLALLQEMAGGMRFGPAFQQLLNPNAAADPNRLRVRSILLVLSEKPERARVPDLVFGFKVSDPKKAADQLKRLDPLLADALKETPLKGRSERAKVGGDEFLVLKLDGSLVPWDMVPIAMFEDEKDEFAPLLKHLKAMKLTVAVGVRQGYLLVGLGESAEALARFGGDGPKLAGRDELKPLAKFADRPLTSVGYTSAKLRRALATKAEDIGGFGDLAKELLKKAELPDEQQKAIEKDIDALIKQIGAGLKPPGAEFNFSFRTDRGWETFAYDYSEPGPGGPKPLALLNHLGGDPLLAAVWRSRTTVEDYREAAKWVAVFWGHAEKAIEAKGPDEAKEALAKFKTDFLPLVRELGDITEKLWIPALDGEQAFVLDAKWTSKRWFALLPETDRALPLPELGIVLGVADAGKFRQALEGYHKTLNKVIAKARELAPPGFIIPELEIPKPKIDEAKGRTTAYYPVPEEWGLEAQIRPTGGLTDKLAALSLSKAHTERMLNGAPLKVESKPLRDPKKALESAFYLNWAGVMDAVGAWVEYAVRQGAFDAAGAKIDDRMEVTRSVLDFLKVFHSYSSATYREGNATVTHSEAIFQDVGPEKK